MFVMRYQPGPLRNRVQGGVDRALGAEQARRASYRQTAARGWVPAVDIREEPDRYLIHADLPGVDPAVLEVSMQDGVLSIKGERGGHQQEQRSGLRRAEREQGSFVRRFSLPDGADADAISATSRHGVLEIVIPKQRERQPRRIQVND